MKRIIPLLLLVMLLWGCGAKEPSVEITTEPSSTTEATLPTLPAGTYDPASAIEVETYGAVKAYPLDMKNVRDVRLVQDSVLVFAGGSNDTRIIQLSGDTLYPESEITINAYLYAGDMRFHNGSISFFHPVERRTVILSLPLQQIKTIDAPEGLAGTPILSEDQQTLYYCTQDSVRALDLGSGISRLLKEISGEDLSVSNLYLQDTVLKVQFSDAHGLWKDIYLSTEDGRTLWYDSGELTLQGFGDGYFCDYYEGTIPMHLSGQLGEPNAKELLPIHPEAQCFYLAGSNGVITAAYTGTAQVLDYYQLSSGLRQATLSFSIDNYIHSITDAPDGQVYFLSYSDIYQCDVLYRWDPLMSLSGDTTVYTADHYSADMPDYTGLEECAAYARAIGEKHGIEILVYKDASSLEPIDYDLETEHNVIVIRRELDFLDQHLQNYPEGFLRTLGEHFDGIRICIVKKLTGSAETGSLDDAAGVQFWDGYTAYIALSAHTNTEYALYHELCHLIDSVVLTQSNAYDRWDSLNPGDFTYDYDYVANIDRNGSMYLQSGSQYFIDSYSMSFPKEDRARIMEYAMTDGNAYFFQSKAMQQKLLTVCQGIRDAFDLKKSPQVFLWEQYLNTSLAYTE